MARRLNRGDVHLYTFSHPDKQRPVVILTQSGMLKHLSTVTVAVITSKIRNVPSAVPLDVDDGMKHPCIVNLHSIHTVSQDRLGPRIGSLSASRLEEICDAIHIAFGCR